VYPTVSIIIPFYNDPYIEQAIYSALSQTYPCTEIVVVDDGSTMYQDRIMPYMKHINYLGKANGGTASALNHGIRCCSGQYIAWLSSDDMFYPDKVERQLKFMLERHAAASYTAFDDINGYNEILRRSVSARFASQAALVRAFASSDPINGCTIMLNKELFTHLGYFNEGLRYTQDYEMWIRVLLGRVPIHFLDESLTMYRWHEQMGTRRHSEAVMQEVGWLQAQYAQRLLDYAAELG